MTEEEKQKLYQQARNLTLAATSDLRPVPAPRDCDEDAEDALDALEKAVALLRQAGCGAGR